MNEGVNLLAIKIGNTNLGFGLFRDKTLARVWRAETRPEKTADEYATLLTGFFEEVSRDASAVNAAAVVSVVPELTETMQDLCQRYFKLDPLVVTAGVRSGIRIKYDDPRSLGADRLVALVAVKARYGGPALVVDHGTATTFNALDAHGDFVGGAIAPGLAMSAQALHEFTAQLPRVEIAPPKQVLATNTHDALLSGIFLGYVSMVEGMITRLRTAMNEPRARVIATGGHAQLVATYCPLIDQVEMNLALDGLRLLYDMNHE